MRIGLTRRNFGLTLGAPFVSSGRAPAKGEVPVRIGSRRELMLDDALIASMRGVALHLATPVDAGSVLRLDQPWEGAFCAYTTLIQEAERCRMYYRGAPVAGQDGNAGEVTCYAESTDGIQWTKPELSFYEVMGRKQNNVILAGEPPYSHNFSPFLDACPDASPTQRYKALAGVSKSGLMAYVSSDGVRWSRLRDEPVFPPPKAFALDSQNIAFWSTSEKRYVLYFRTWKKIGAVNYRWVSRATSSDFLHWSAPVEMDYGNAPPEHLYTNQTSAYFRAPHHYIGICARFMPGRQVISESQAWALGVDPRYYQDCSDAVLVTSRGGNRYTRTFMEAFLRPGVGLENWVSRSNYPALNLVQTGPATMSFYVNRNYGQPTAHLRRYELRLDGLASARAGYSGGELLTRALVFDGSRLELNYSASAAGSVRVELQDESGRAITGFALADSRELVGDEIERIYAWKGGENVSRVRGKTVRVRFVLKDADLFAFRFPA